MERKIESSLEELIPDPTLPEIQQDVNILREERLSRAQDSMKTANADIAQQLFGQNEDVDGNEKAAVCIQKHYRGYQGRKEYEKELYDQYLKEENFRQEKIHEQVEEGDLLVENHKLEVLLDDDLTTRRNKDRQYLSKIITLQRAWRSHLQDKHQTERDDQDNTNADIKANGGKNKLSYLRDKKSPMKQLQDDSDSVLSDYSEVTNALKDIADSEINIIGKNELQNSASLEVQKSLADSDLDRLPGESEENYSRRIKKFNFLSLAQEFAELKKIDADASPYDTIKRKKVKKAEEKNESNMTSVINLENNMGQKKKLEMNSSVSEVDGKMTESGDFEVYNIETALPPIDWETIEQQIQLASAAANEKKKETQPNDRETIRQKLAMGGGEEEYYYNERAFKKPSFQTRLQSGMNLQICFMNEAMNEANNTLPDSAQVTSSSSSQQSEQSEQQHQKPSTTERHSPPVKHTEVKNGHRNKRGGDRTRPKDDNNKTSHPSRLKEEAKIALAQASTMAHMQLEVEKQLKKKSPIADMVGIPSLGDGRRKKFNRKLLQEMNLAQLQILVNDVHTQIESLNEELVHLLIERDDLHMEQDSMLVDVEDLTRYVSPAK